MTVRQAARRLEVAPSTVYALIAAGKLCVAARSEAGNHPHFRGAAHRLPE